MDPKCSGASAHIQWTMGNLRDLFQLMRNVCNLNYKNSKLHIFKWEMLNLQTMKQALITALTVTVEQIILPGSPWNEEVLDSEK